MQTAYIGADHRGYNLKEQIKIRAEGESWDLRDLGNHEYDKEDDYSEISINLAETVAREKTKGILICGSGVGVCVAANKVKGVRAALGFEEKQVRKAREDDDVNILCLAADFLTEEKAIKLVEIFLETLFVADEGHVRRLQKIKEYEST